MEEIRMSIDREENYLDIFYAFRDILFNSENSLGKEFVKVYYLNTEEIRRITTSDVAMFSRMIDAVQKSEPLIKDFVFGHNQQVLSQELANEIILFARDMQSKANIDSRLSSDIDTALELLNLKNSVGLTPRQIWENVE